jgi:hypothetical protein
MSGIAAGRSQMCSPVQTVARTKISQGAPGCREGAVFAQTISSERCSTSYRRGTRAGRGRLTPRGSPPTIAMCRRLRNRARFKCDRCFNRKDG